MVAWAETATATLPASKRARHAFMMLTAFMDDSGSDNQGPVFVMAGYLSYAPIWANFDSAWQTALGQLPALRYFKMSEARALRGQFQGWAAEDRDNKVGGLVAVINRQPIITALILSLTWQDFWRAKSEFPDITDCHPYDMLFHGVMATVTELLVKNKRIDTVDFVFDEQGACGERALLTYRKIRSVLPPAQADLVAGSPRFANDTKTPPLQAADLLAWHVRRYFDEQGVLPIARTQGMYAGAPQGKPTVKPGYIELERLLQNESIVRRYDYAAIRRIYEAWTTPLSDLRERGDL